MHPHRKGHRHKRPLIIGSLTLLIILSASYGTYILMNARTYQAFGQLYARVETDEKVVALTFDDGPEPGPTEYLLEILDQKQVKATFMLNGNRIDAHPELARAIAAAGHEIANHTYSHKRMVLRSSEFYAREIEATDKAIRTSGYSGQIHFRPPYGKKLIGLPLYLYKHDRTTIMWDVEPETKLGAGATSRELTHFASREVRPGSIILLHPMGATNQASLHSVAPLIDALQAKGYRFVTASELLRYAQSSGK